MLDDLIRVSPPNAVTVGDPWISAGLGVVVALLAFTVVTDLRRPDRVPDDAGPDPRVPLFRRTTVALWVTAVACVTAWLAAGGTASEAGLNLPRGVALGWTVAAIVVVGALPVAQIVIFSRSAEARDQMVDQLGTAGYDWLRPTTRSELVHFQVLGTTAGITEEVIFRGFLIGALALWMPVPLAAVVSVAVFIGGHVYQGAAGMLRILPISVVLTLVYLVTGSLLAGIVLHVAVDVVGGVLMWRLRDRRESRQA